MLEAVKLSKTYEDGYLALDGLDLKVDRGEIFGLLGANGAGKTTTINLFLNFIDPTDGEAIVNGISVQRDPLEARRYVAYVAENVVLYPTLTARENLEFFARLGGRSSLSREDYYRILTQVGIHEDAREQRIGQFSKGMRQKIGIAVAIVHDTPAILLDEPTSGLDPKAAADFLDLLRDLRHAGKAILMSSHDIFRARQVCDRIGIMKRGRLLTVRTRAELEGEDLEAVYLDYMKN